MGLRVDGVDLLAEALASRPGATAVTDEDGTWSFQELDRAATVLAREITESLGGTDGTVCVLLPPSPDAVVAIHGVLRTGALLAPLNPALTPAELARALGALAPRLVLTGPDTVGPAREAVERAARDEELAAPPEVRVASGLLDAAAGSGPSGSVEDEPEVTNPGASTPGTSRTGAGGPDTGRPAAVLWTSGTSGRPRGVLLTAGALRHSAVASARRLGLGRDDRWYASLAVAHVGGLAMVARAAILGSALVATGAFRAEELSALIDRGEVTHASLVPTMLRRLLDHREGRPPPPTLRCLLVGGAACPPPLLERALESEMPVALTWGMTETTSQAATAPPDLVRRDPGTVGPPLDGVEIRIEPGGMDAGERPDPAGFPEGEILVRGPVLAAGVLGSDEPVTDADGWFRTGDLGRLDERGHLRVTGRRSDRIITGGVNVDPSEVEAAILSHPDVIDAAVVGLPDAEWGERVTAAVVAAPGSVPVPDGEALRAWLRERLAGAKVPKSVTVLPALPRNPNGKVDRAALREELGPPG